jgi:tetratricopeptide (TPR) repeat protein
LFRQATEMDPTFAPAHGSLALAYAVAQFFDVLTQEESLSLTAAAADAAFALDPDNVEALLARGYVLAMAELRISEGEAMLRRVLELRPNDITAINLLGDFAALSGNRAAAFEFESRAADLDPLESIHQMELGYVHLADRNWDQALAYARSAEALEPLNLRSPALEVQALMFRGDLAAAEARYESAVAANRYVWGRRADGCLLDIASGDAARQAACVQRADAAHRRGEMPAGGRAVVHYMAGEYAEAASLLRAELASGNTFWIAGPFALDMYMTLVREGHELPAPEKFDELFALWAVSEWASLPPMPGVLADVRNRGVRQ